MITAPLISLAAFVLVFIGIGFYYRHKTSSEDFYVAGRRGGFLRILASTFTLMGAGEVVTLTAFAYLFGLWGIGLFAGYFVGLVLLGYLSGRIREQSEHYKPYTVTDYIRKLIGVKTEKIALILSLIGVGSLLIIQLVVGGMLISSVTVLSYAVAVLMMALIIAVYLSFGGFNSVLATDVLQGVGMLILLFFLALFYNPAGTLTIDLASSFSQIPLTDFITLLISGVVAVFGSADVYHRIYAAKNNQIAKKGMFASGISILAFGFLMIFVGLQIQGLYPDIDPNEAFMTFLSGDLSPFIASIFAVFLMASILSTADSELFLSSILVGRLIRGEKELSRDLGRILLWSIVTITVAIAVFSTALVDIYLTLVFSFMIIGPVMLARIYGRGTDIVAAGGMIISFILLVIFLINDTLTGFMPLVLLLPPMAAFLVPAKPVES